MFLVHGTTGIPGDSFASWEEPEYRCSAVPVHVIQVERGTHWPDPMTPAATLEPSDALVTNDPWLGTGHMNDINMVMLIHEAWMDRYGEPLVIRLKLTVSGDARENRWHKCRKEPA